MNIKRPEYTKKRTEVWSGDIVSVLDSSRIGESFKVRHVDHKTRTAICDRVNTDGTQKTVEINGTQWPLIDYHFQVSSLRIN